MSLECYVLIAHVSRCGSVRLMIELWLTIPWNASPDSINVIQLLPTSYLINKYVPIIYFAHCSCLTFWRRNYFCCILAHPVYKMWIIQEPNTLELWNILHFEEKKKRRVYTMFKIFGTYICWINIYNATLEVSGAVRQL